MNDMVGFFCLFLFSLEWGTEMAVLVHGIIQRNIFTHTFTSRELLPCEKAMYRTSEHHYFLGLHTWVRVSILHMVARRRKLT